MFTAALLVMAKTWNIYTLEDMRMELHGLWEELQDIVSATRSRSVTVG